MTDTQDPKALNLREAFEPKSSTNQPNSNALFLIRDCYSHSTRSRLIQTHVANTHRVI